MEDKKLSEEEIEKIVETLCERLTEKVYKNVGEGVVGLIWKAVILVCIALAAYGASGGLHFWK